jgi:L-ascorbate metabolism protein UlaG (beta-lactamase superfamily)
MSTERAGRSVSLTWYGQAGFRLAAGDSRVLIDPFLTDRDDRNYRPPARAADFAAITLVLCTHEHVDHLDLPFLRELCAVNPAARSGSSATCWRSAASARATPVTLTLP